MLMLEARDICGAATGRNGQFSFCGFAFYSHALEGMKTDEPAIQEGS